MNKFRVHTTNQIENDDKRLSQRWFGEKQRKNAHYWNHGEIVEKQNQKYNR